MIAEDDALLIVDVQRDFLPGGALAVPRGDEVIPALNAVAAEFAAAGRAVVASRDWHPPEHCSFESQGGPWPPHCIADSSGAQFDARLELPADTKVVSKASRVDKDAYSAFEDTGLHEWLQQRGIRRLYVGGLATDYCVLRTAADAVRNGYAVVLLEDAIRAIEPKAGKHAIESLRGMGASVKKTSEILDDSC